MARIDAELWRGFLNEPGDLNFAPLYEQTRALVYTICIRTLRNTEDAQDAFQSTYCRLFAMVRHGAEALPPGEPEAVLCRLAIRESDNLRKRRARRSRREKVMDPLPPITDPQPSADKVAASRQLREQLEGLLCELPERHRLALTLYYFQGMSEREVASALGKSSGAIHYRLERARSALGSLARQAGLTEAARPLGALVGGAILVDPPSSFSAGRILDGAKVSTHSSGGWGAFDRLGSFVEKVPRIRAMWAFGAAALLAFGIVALIARDSLWGRADRPGADAAAIPAIEAAAIARPSQSDSPAEGIGSRRGQSAPLAPAAAIGDAEAASEPPTAVHESSVPPATTEIASLGPQSAATEPAKEEQIGASIFGTVVRAEDETPVPGVLVMLRLGNTAGPITTTSDDEGRFEFSGLKPNLYFLTASKEEENLTSIRVMSDTVTAPVREAEGRTGPLKIPVFTGRKLTVRVKRADGGGAIAGTTVAFGYRQPNVFRSTDESGETTIKGLNRIGGTVWVFAPGFAAATRFVSTAAQEENFVEVEVESGGEIYGVVRDANGDPLADVLITASVPNVYKYIGTQSDALGFYELGHIPFGQRINLSFSWDSSSASRGGELISPEEYPLAALSATWLERFSAGNRMSRVLELSSAEPQQKLDIVWGETAPAVGTGVIVGTVVDAEGQPVDGASIEFGFPRESDRPAVESGEDGTFRLENLLEGGSRQLLVRASGYAPSTASAEPGTPEEPVSVTLRLEPGHWIKGRVLIAPGQPATAGVVVEAYSSAGSLARTITDEQGRFELVDLPADARFTFRQGPYRTLSGQELALDGPDVEVILPRRGILVGYVRDEETNLPIRRYTLAGNFEGGDRGGYAIDSENGYFRLRLVTGGARLRVTVQASGYATKVFENIIPGTDTDFEPVVLELTRGGRTLRGVLVDADGDPVFKAEVTLLLYSGLDRSTIQFNWRNWNDLFSYRGRYAIFEKQTTDEEGRFEFLDLPTQRLHPVDLVIRGEGLKQERITGIEELDESQWENLIVTLE